MRLSAEEFRKVLESAIAGNKNDIETIIDLYLPLINRFSVINGVIDEDLRQELMIHHPEAKTISPTSRAAYHLGGEDSIPCLACSRQFAERILKCRTARQGNGQ